ncbi:hypothetical protein PAS25_25245 [Leclercia adecarboxylata]|uniref:hypothetical protein n=1 Tax=Leclercia adecarboxylata TaxID=83655 RepID=UPI001117D69A|nr:hypothetical protein [Leclercia adecarboxylata]QCZ28922.1 hypothetical protein FHN83_20740 [Leclercia adecarboxylata]
MKDLYLRFTDAAEMRTKLNKAGFVFDEEQGILSHPDISLDIIGIIAVPSGINNTGEENEYIQYINLPGYHANLRVMNDSLDLSGLNDFVVTPKTPARVWA